MEFGATKERNSIALTISQSAPNILSFYINIYPPRIGLNPVNATEQAIRHATIQKKKIPNIICIEQSNIVKTRHCMHTYKITLIRSW